ncbi:TULP9 [Symbiodinium pilosum]|uniref:TULP9 protein n=1 Tax=Symbiodinium pilosum TaxID=2952 RepID=A0A812VN09_SYMPI|nr:TULP9 [Symbiodinium pilosum]
MTNRACGVLVLRCSGAEEVGGCVLTTRRPRWNPRQKTLTLDFHGRCSLASAKNFQLEAEGDASRVVLLFGKVEKDRFVLDYGHPLGAVQAFAAALSASHWK